MLRPTLKPYPPEVTRPTDLATQADRLVSQADPGRGRRAPGIGAASRGLAASAATSASPPQEVALAHPHGEAQSRLERRLLGRDVRGPGAVPLLEPERVDRPVATGDHARAGWPAAQRDVPQRPRRTRRARRAPSRARRHTSPARARTGTGPHAHWCAVRYGKAAFDTSSARGCGQDVAGPRAPQARRLTRDEGDVGLR